MMKYPDESFEETHKRLHSPVWMEIKRLIFRITNSTGLPKDGYYSLARLIYNEVRK